MCDLALLTLQPRTSVVELNKFFLKLSLTVTLMHFQFISILFIYSFKYSNICLNKNKSFRRHIWCHFSPWSVCKKHIPDTIEVHTNIFFAKNSKLVAIYFHECLTVLQPLLIIFPPHIFCDLFHRLHCSKHTKKCTSLQATCYYFFKAAHLLL